ncbi:uncharacterized protein LOC131043287 [Cryptomeria japonica]|uniref:uncharacterized protein LOC131043287 n=1 Tax=Cryptomeria japonica TaxID=3369 RepID=UPI0027DA957F|nr:uncharacterized protein LOC131043287 [Cryptomeria japonica]
MGISNRANEQRASIAVRIIDQPMKMGEYKASVAALVMLVCLGSNVGFGMVMVKANPTSCCSYCGVGHNTAFLGAGLVPHHLPPLSLHTTSLPLTTIHRPSPTTTTTTTIPAVYPQLHTFPYAYSSIPATNIPTLHPQFYPYAYSSIPATTIPTLHPKLYPYTYVSETITLSTFSTLSWLLSLMCERLLNANANYMCLFHIYSH